MVLLSNLLSLAATLTLASAAAICCPDQICHTIKSRSNITAQTVGRELGPLLSPEASIFTPVDEGFTEANDNYNVLGRPHFFVIVQAGQECDIPVIIQYANLNGIPFYTRNRGHALADTRGKFYGLQINMQDLRGVQVSADRTYATIQGGAYGQELIDELYAQKLTATTGSCSCVGLLGAGLGGGWGKWQGFHGLISDNFISLNVVLANGTAITVSNDSHPDLFWALQGAGHNFGVVTSFVMKVHPLMFDTWFQKNYVFTEDKLEAVFEQLNTLNANGSQPQQMGEQAGYFALNTSIDATRAVISWQFSWAGPPDEAQVHLAPFDALGPVWTENITTPYNGVAAAAGSSVGQPLCAEGLSRVVGPATLLQYNLTTQRQVYDLYNSKILVHPALNYSFVVMEGYPQQVVRSVDPALSAYPWRGENIYTQIMISYEADSSLDAFANEWAIESQSLMNAGQPDRKPVAYVNYAGGREPVEWTYGYEPWRLERLRDLKAKYDPENKFAYFKPIIPPTN
ncbi:hypothetical protein F5Y18DRAFT_440019 [Xylariaceae sp. FL1019]|nr:hypothetical protein F5Y18DRAFT_440019 [Xylariaceae sp. FL1019]